MGHFGFTCISSFYRVWFCLAVVVLLEKHEHACTSARRLAYKSSLESAKRDRQVHSKRGKRATLRKSSQPGAGQRNVD